MNKLYSPFKGGIQIFQANHGILQQKLAFDLAGVKEPLNFYAPCDGIIERVYRPKDKKQWGCWFKVNDNFAIQIHHSENLKLGAVKKGTLIAKSTWHHFHVSIKNKLFYGVLLDYIDRTTPLFCQFNPKYSNWNTYTDRSVPNPVSGGLIINNNEVGKIKHNFIVYKDNTPVYDDNDKPVGTINHGLLDSVTRWRASSVIIDSQDTMLQTATGKWVHSTDVYTGAKGIKDTQKVVNQFPNLNS